MLAQVSREGTIKAKEEHIGIRKKIKSKVKRIRVLEILENTIFILPLSLGPSVVISFLGHLYVSFRY